MSPSDKLSYNINEAAAALGVSRSKIYALVRAGELTVFKWCGRTLIDAEVLKNAQGRASGRLAA